MGGALAQQGQTVTKNGSYLLVAAIFSNLFYYHFMPVPMLLTFMVAFGISLMMFTVSDMYISLLRFLSQSLFLVTDELSIFRVFFNDLERRVSSNAFFTEF